MHLLLPLAALAACLCQKATAKAVFAHYMVGNTYEEHIHKDIDDAAAIGLDGFALNIGDPRQAFVKQSLDYMFDYARNNHPSFKLFISMDLWAAGDTEPKQSAKDFVSLIKQYMTHGAYQRGPAPDQFPMVSTFADGGLTNDTWIEWRDEVGDVFLIPDFDGTKGYYQADPGWWAYWGDIVDGLFSWESAWPLRAGYGGAYPGDVGPDETVIEGAANHSKPYMIPLSPLQYKNAYHTNIYRAGDVGMPLRMTNILKMDPSPEYVQIVTWNDGPESHYIGNLWTEQNNDTDPARYATEAEFSHAGWQSLIGSFVSAFKSNQKATDMRPHAAEEFTGAMWYKTILKDTICPWDGASEYFVKPDGFSSSSDTLNFAVVMPAAGYYVELYSGGEKIVNAELHEGLNYGTLPGLRAGWQRMHIVDSAGNIKRVAAGGRCVSDGCPDCIYNMNSQVVPLSDNTEDSGGCPETSCGGVDVYVPGSVWTDTPEIQCLPPCTFVLPPFQLSTATTISWPMLTTTFWWLSSGTTTTKTSYIYVPPFTTTEIQLWTITADSTDTEIATIKPIQNVMPPQLTLNLPSTVATFAPTRVGVSSQPSPTFYSSPHPEIIQLQPTVQITPMPSIPNITYTSAKPSSTCTDHCGGYDCSRFGCPSDDEDSEDGDGDDDSHPVCGKYACDSGCGIWGCGGGCGLFGCGGGSGGCALSKCGGLGCAFGSCGTAGGEGGDSDPSSTRPCSTQTASACTTACVAGSTTSCSTVCSTRTACTATGTSTAVTGTPAPGSDFVTEDWPDYRSLISADGPDTAWESWLTAHWPTATTTTSKPTTATSTTAAPTATSSGYVEVALYRHAVQGESYYQWYIYKGIRKSSSDEPDICDDPDKSDSVASGEVTWPDSDWDLGSIGNYENCEYKGNSDGAGTVACDNLDTVQCESVTHSEEQCGTDLAFSIFYSTPWLQCSWGNTLGDD